jgi:hypothetical protein
VHEGENWPIYRRVVMEKEMKLNTCLIVQLRANKEMKAKQVLHCLVSTTYYYLSIFPKCLIGLGSREKTI